MRAQPLKKFSPAELAFMQDGTLFDQKEDLTKRIQSLLQTLADALRDQIQPEDLKAPDGTDFSRGHLVRGERFHQRPYVYLDLPKFFSRQAIFTYRSFFWWGWDFVFAMILSGPFLDFYRNNLVRSLDRIAGKGFYLSLAPHPWEWHKSSPHTVPLGGQSPEALGDILRRVSFLKIQHFVGLDDPLWLDGGVVEKGVEVFNQLRFVVAK